MCFANLLLPNYNRLTCLPLPKHPLWYQTGFDQQPNPFDLKNQDLLHHHPSSCKNRLTYSYLPNENYATHDRSEQSYYCWALDLYNHNLCRQTSTNTLVYCPLNC